MKSIKIGEIAVDGGAATVLTVPGQVRENTIKVTPAAPTDTEFYAEGESTPAIVQTKKGITALDFDLLTFDPEIIADLTGGTTTGEAPNILYHEAAGVVTVERTIEITDLQDNVWLFPRVKITASLVGTFTTTDVNIVRINGKVLLPTKAGVAPLTYGKPAA
ncbi:hypothetical protein FW774_17330 [Pedobacter sp. BS3]|uniref:hypothetical protein n=1 Tax=Pedobacter sp. BS3 TaxID=2567937 RepID=UPI0011EEF958|nr:hypothetical protein [Pedobacter sp. BS3]TZF81818.1 hypothetical protein FW774_17330 [Pedobacter sp. BS3]